MPSKKRLDILIVEKKLCESRQKAQAMIMAGNVFVAGQRADKPGMQLQGDEPIEVRTALPYVSRGGLKLEKAMGVFDISLTGKTCCDIGASTGGFTDCMLQNGAKRVYAVDVGYGQLAWKLRSDLRVVSMERQNFRYVTKAQIPEPLDFASVDVSFISLALILPVLYPLMDNNACAVCLIKPQFEAGRDKVGKKGVVRDSKVHEEVICNIIQKAVSNGFSVLGLDYSPVKGPEGNIEYLLYLAKQGRPVVTTVKPAGEIVRESHKALDKPLWTPGTKEKGQ